jgi:hypothetical protein
MLDDNIPIIEESVTNSGEKQSSTLTYLSCLMPSLETIMKSKVCRAPLPKRLEQVETKGCLKPVLGREEPFNRHVWELAQRLLREI